ncbi:MAG: ribonuclease H-like YkuK family protein [Bacillota bacterium]
MYFISPTKGPMSFEAMFDDIVDFVAQEPMATYRLIVGSDSQTRDDLLFVTAVVIHRLGQGARYYYNRRRHKRMATLRQKIYYETSLSLGLGSRIAERLARNGYSKLDVEIHLDIGQGGETRDLIREVVGMVTGSGFDAKIKPNAYGASKVADKHTK